MPLRRAQRARLPENALGRRPRSSRRCRPAGSRRAVLVVAHDEPADGAARPVAGLVAALAEVAAVPPRVAGLDGEADRPATRCRGGSSRRTAARAGAVAPASGSPARSIDVDAGPARARSAPAAIAHGRLLQPVVHPLHTRPARSGGSASRYSHGVVGRDEPLVPHVLRRPLEAVLVELAGEPEQHAQRRGDSDPVRRRTSTSRSSSIQLVRTSRHPRRQRRAVRRSHDRDLDRRRVGIAAQPVQRAGGRPADERLRARRRAGRRSARPSRRQLDAARPRRRPRIGDRARTPVRRACLSADFVTLERRGAARCWPPSGGRRGTRGPRDGSSHLPWVSSRPPEAEEDGFSRAVEARCAMPQRHQNPGLGRPTGSTSRWVVRTAVPRARRRVASSSAMATERWRPPVQPMAIVR